MNKVRRIQCLILSILFFLTTISPAAYASNIDLGHTANKLEKKVSPYHFHKHSFFV